MSCASLIPEHWFLLSAKTMCCSFLCLVLLLAQLPTEFTVEILSLTARLCCPSLNIFKPMEFRLVDWTKFQIQRSLKLKISLLIELSKPDATTYVDNAQCDVSEKA